MAVSAIKNWWNTYQLDKSDTNDSNTEEDKEEIAGRRLCKLFSHLDKMHVYCMWSGNPTIDCQVQARVFLLGERCGQHLYMASPP